MRTLVILVVCVACNGDHDPDAYVGATCRDDRDCADECLRGSDYPGGFCTLACRDDRDCPDDAICVDRDGFVCLYACDVDADCDFLGPYRCKDEQDWTGRNVGACLGD
jgi:hypothetical protein